MMTDTDSFLYHTINSTPMMSNSWSVSLSVTKIPQTVHVQLEREKLILIHFLIIFYYYDWISKSKVYVT